MTAEQLTPDRLDVEETYLCVVFPESYRQFMLSQNGGQPDPCFFVYKNEVNCIASLNPITDSEVDTLNLRGANRILGRMALSWGMPCDCFTIGRAGGDESILLFYKGRRRNQVWIKDWFEADPKRDLDRDTDPEEGLYHLADSVGEFVSRLCTEEEAERRAAQ